ncbi:MAG: prepilin-type N-terminal cleavage/methylation domain-containing protein [Patescibacteria group bacterium]
MQNKRSGFTLIEMMIYIVIFAIVATLGATVFDFALRTKDTTNRLTEAQSGVQQALQQMVDKVYTATDINGASTTLNLKMSDSTKNPTVFSLASGALMMQEGTGTAVAVTPSTIYVTALSFTKLNNTSSQGTATSSVQIRITGGYNEGSAADTKSLYTLETAALSL